MELSKVGQLQWKKFLSSDAGIEGLNLLRLKTPGINKGEPHEMIYDGGRNQGYANCLDRVIALTEDRKVEIQEENR